MDQIALGNSGRSTTRLGFGCSSLMGATGRRESLRLLESAFDAGIRHFDVAPMYGYGEAESCLGEFLQRHRSDVTVTTKYGIPPAKSSPLIGFARAIAGPVLKTLPGLKQRLTGVAHAVTHNDERATFTAEQASASLQRSLAALCTDRIDVWLLHEVTAADLKDDALLHFLEDQTAQGTIGAFGIGSSPDKIEALLAQHPAYCRILQYEWSVLDTTTPPSNSFRIHHRALTSNFQTLHAALAERKDIYVRWSQAVATDLAEPANLARLMLKASLVLNPASIILFSSKKPKHIQSNVQAANDASLDAPAQTLYNLVQAEIAQLFPRPV